MTKRIKIEPEEGIKFTFSLAEREAVLEHTFAHPSLTDRLRLTEVVEGGCRASYTIDEMDELLGFVAAEANHTKNKKLGKVLDRLFERLQGEMEAHDDGRWPE